MLTPEEIAILRARIRDVLPQPGLRPAIARLWRGLPETFEADAMEIMTQHPGVADWGDLNLAALWYRHGYHRGQEMPAPTMEGRLTTLDTAIVQGEEVGRALLALTGPKEAIRQLAPLFLWPLEAAVLEEGLWISLVDEPPEAPEVPQNPTHNPTHGSTP